METLRSCAGAHDRGGAGREWRLIHHVGIEVLAADLPRAREFWGIVGLVEVEPPESLGGGAVWLEGVADPRFQVHLMPVDDPVAPRTGHLAIVATEYRDVVERLRESGFEVEDRRRHWGSPRCFCHHPGGHTVELMQEPPAPGRN